MTMFRAAIARGALLAAAIAIAPPVARAEEPSPATAAVNRVGIQLLLQQAANRPGETVLLSPYGLGVLLSMLAQGAEDETAAQIETLLGPAADAEAMAALRAALHEAGRDTLAQANAVWLAEGLAAHGTFTHTLAERFAAALDIVDFTAPETEEQLNAWARKATNGLIDSVAGELPPDAVLVAANALHFAGSWAAAFDPDDTSLWPFRGSAETVVVPMMFHHGLPVVWHTGEDARAVDLPFADGLVLSLVQPVAEDGFADWLAGVDADRLAALLQTRTAVRPGYIGLPELDLAAGIDLLEPLAALGLDALSDFGGIADGPITISAMLQQVALQVDEEGAEAASVTAAVGTRTADGETTAEPLTFMVDRPTLLAIRDLETGTILFLVLLQDL